MRAQRLAGLIRLLPLLLLAGVTLRLVACSSNFEEQSQITRLRVLGVQAEPAELILQDGGPLPSTTLTALAIDPSGAMITTDFSLCLQQGLLPMPGIDCPGDAGHQLPDAGALSARLDLSDPAVQAVAISFELSFDGGFPGGADAGDGGLTELLAQGVPIAVGFSADSPANQNPDGGPPPTAGYSEQHLLGFAEVTLRTASATWPVNHNPSLTGVTQNDLLIAADGSTVLHAGKLVTFNPVPASDAKEPLPDGGVEALDYSFFSTDGSLASLRSADTTATGQPGITTVDYTPSLLPSTAPVRLWVVIRDGRGGIGWIERDFTVAP